MTRSQPSRSTAVCMSSGASRHKLARIRFGPTRVAGRDQHLDDGDVVEVAEIRDGQVDQGHQTVTGLGLLGSMSYLAIA